VGLSTATAAEFSFLLGLPTLGAACVYEGIKSRHVLAQGIGLSSFVVGLVVSFLVAWAVISVWFLYRIIKGMIRMNAGQSMEN